MAFNFKNLPDIATTQPERLIKYRISEDKFSAEVLLPGLWYTDFDKKIGGKVSLWSLEKLFESVRAIEFIHGLLERTPNLMDMNNVTMFLVSVRASFTKHFHSLREHSHFGHDFPLHAVYSVCDVGQTSFVASVDLINHRTKELLVTCTAKTVRIDVKSRRPTPLPSDFIKPVEEFLSGNNIERRSIPKSPLLRVPEGTFKYSAQALHSDCDMNYHVNQAVFTRWASDAASVAAIQGKLTHFRHHIELYPLKALNRSHFGEVLVNEKVTVYVWESAEDSTCLNIAMMKGEKLIVSLRMEFYDGLPADVAHHLRSMI